MDEFIKADNYEIIDSNYGIVESESKPVVIKTPNIEIDIPTSSPSQKVTDSVVLAAAATVIAGPVAGMVTLGLNMIFGD